MTASLEERNITGLVRGLLGFVGKPVWATLRSADGQAAMTASGVMRCALESPFHGAARRTWLVDVDSASFQIRTGEVVGVRRHTFPSPARMVVTLLIEMRDGSSIRIEDPIGGDLDGPS